MKIKIKIKKKTVSKKPEKKLKIKKEEPKKIKLKIKKEEPKKKRGRARKLRAKDVRRYDERKEAGSVLEAMHNSDNVYNLKDSTITKSIHNASTHHTLTLYFDSGRVMQAHIFSLYDKNGKKEEYYCGKRV
ncbi:MAG: hypothetical protein RBR32_03645 [Bacteroidales bacterium]|nr:hypothetical protein [Bacteroidales bacterium]